VRNLFCLERNIPFFGDRHHYLHSSNVLLCELDQFSVLGSPSSDKTTEAGPILSEKGLIGEEYREWAKCLLL